mgnify:CR=1 FL=1
MCLNKRLIIVAVLFFLSGCAGFSVQDDNDKPEVDGIRYYEPAPFLLIYSDGKGNLTSQIIMMPDTQKKRVIDMHAFAAKNNTTLSFNKGVLESSKFVVDSTALPSTLITSIKSLGTAAISAAFNAPESGITRQIPAPYLYKIVIGKDGTKLVGGQGTGPKNEQIVLYVGVTKEATTKAAAVTKTPAATTPVVTTPAKGEN